MSVVVAEPERIDIRYTGVLAEPAFALLGNPAPLYTNLLREFGPFGAELKDLSIDLSALARANVGCGLPFGHVRVWVDNLEVYIRDVQTIRQAETVISSAWRAVQEIDQTVRPVRHTLAFSTWARMKDEPFSAYIRRFVIPLSGSENWKPSVEFNAVAADGKAIAAFELQESSLTPEGLFFRSIVTLASPQWTADLADAFVSRVRGLLASAHLELPLASGQE